MLIAFVGPSGAGKDAVAKRIEEQYGIKALKGYTTRPSRGEDDTGNVCVSMEVYYITPKDDILCETVYGGERYWKLKSDITGEPQILIVDKKGLVDLFYTQEQILIIFFMADRTERIKRIYREYKDKYPALAKELTTERVDRDKNQFTDIKVDWVIDANDEIDTVATRVMAILDSYLY